MVASAVPSVPASINTLILLAYKRAGLLPVEARLSGANMAPKLEHGRQLLDLLLDSLATEGFIARTTSFYDLPITAGEPYYTLPDSILDVFEDAMFVPNDNADTKHTTGEMVCKQIDMTSWQALTTKGTTSTRPQLYVSLRSGATCMLRFWPVPDETGTMRLKTIRLLGGNADGTKNPDLQRYWFSFLVWALAHSVAEDSSMPADKVTRLSQMADVERRKCVSYSFEQTGVQAMIEYPNQWSK